MCNIIIGYYSGREFRVIDLKPNTRGNNPSLSSSSFCDSSYPL